jgi:hypothetical protein
MDFYLNEEIQEETFLEAKIKTRRVVEELREFFEEEMDKEQEIPLLDCFVNF